MKRTRSNSSVSSEVDRTSDDDYAPTQKKATKGVTRRQKATPPTKVRRTIKLSSTVKTSSSPPVNDFATGNTATADSATGNTATSDFSSKPTAFSNTAASDTGNADTTTGKNKELASAISSRARLPQVDLGAVELLTFFPNHMRWPEAGLRLYRNGWKVLAVSKAMLHARNKIDRRSDKAVEKRRSAGRHQILRSGRVFFTDDTFTPSNHAHLMTPVSTYDASNYAPYNVATSSLFTAKLVDIAKGVVYWPKGEDRGIVTQAIEYAVATGNKDLTTEDIPQLAIQHHFQAPAEASSSFWDQNAQERSEGRIGITGNYRPEGRFDDHGFEPEEEDSSQ